MATSDMAFQCLPDGIDRRFIKGLDVQFSYTLLDQKSSGLDTGNSSLGGVAYNPFLPNNDYGTEAFVSRHRFVAYGIYDLPVGRGRQYGSKMSRWADAFIGGWQTTFNLFAKSGTASHRTGFATTAALQPRATLESLLSMRSEISARSRFPPRAAEQQL